MAMLDAVELSDELLNPLHPNTHAALKAYEAKMQKRMIPVIEETLKFTDMFHSKEAIPFFKDFFSENSQ